MTCRAPLALAACTEPGALDRHAAPITTDRWELDEAAFSPLPLAPPLPSPSSALGAALFSTRLLSEDQRTSCADCHRPEHGFADDRPLTLVEGRPTALSNVPSLLNTRYLSHYNWSGRFTSLGAHLDALIENPSTHGTTWRAISRRLQRDAKWSARCVAVFPDGCTEENTRAALLAYEESLVGTGSLFDQWLLGALPSLPLAAKRGLTAFNTLGCSSCHQGQLLGGNLFQKLGVIETYLPAEVRDAPEHEGRFAVTGVPEDRNVFRVPSLRNVADTSPYLHDGSVAALGGVVQLMARYQLGRTLTAAQVQDIVAFLGSLSAPLGAPSAP